MEFDFNDLGAFATDELVEKTVSLLDNGEPLEGVVFVKRLPSVEIDRFSREASHSDVDIAVNAIPRLLSKAIRKSDGKAQFTAEKAGKLTNFNRTALLNVVMEVNKRAATEDLGNA